MNRMVPARSRGARVARRLASLLLAAATATACRQLDTLREAAASGTAYERYVAGLRSAHIDSTALGRDWIAAGERALAGAAPVALPFRESFYVAPTEAAAVGYRFDGRRGQRLVVELASESDAGPATVFLDLYSLPADTGAPLRRVTSAEDGARRIETELPRNGAYVLRLQPELLRGGRFTVAVRATASIAFPVSGRTDRAVQSFFGSERDAGRRTHQGVDIFAPRGTPALAAVNGRVWVGTNQLGGLVVFLRDDRTGHNLYYAHLSAQTVTTGQAVHVGDTVGLVGNTGNARTTPPHLHFGIYRRGEGALDPWPFIHTPRGEPPPVSADLAALGQLRRLRRGGAELKVSPSAQSRGVRLEGQGVVAVRGAAGAWYQVRTPAGEAGYVAASATEPADAPIATFRSAASVAVREGPRPGAATVDSVLAPVSLPVLARCADYVYVRTPRGAAGWVLRTPDDARPAAPPRAECGTAGAG